MCSYEVRGTNRQVTLVIEFVTVFHYFMARWRSRVTSVEYLVPVDRCQANSRNFCDQVRPFNLNTRYSETIQINSIGDQLARWTSMSIDHLDSDILLIICILDDIFKSTVHRAVNRSSARRYSMPLFFGTDYHVKLEVCTIVSQSC